MNPLGMIAGTVSRSLKISMNAAGFAMGVVKKGVAAAGRSTSEWPGRESATETAPEGTRIMDIDTTAEPERVNVVGELDLDPAPVDEPTPTEPDQEPVTTIDAAADPDHVEATPADVAEAVSKDDSPRSGQV